MRRIGSGRKKRVHGAKHCERLDVFTLDSMGDAVRLVEDQLRFSRIGWDIYDGGTTRLRMMGKHEPQPELESFAEELVMLALEEDPALAAKSTWERREFADVFDAGLIASGDERPCFERVRRGLSDASGSDPVEVVVSTDKTGIDPRAWSAFVAAVRIVQQFRPVHVWWQGSWLNEGRTKGHVFLVPLVQGDMDFSRVSFAVSDPMRDRISHGIRTGRVLETKEIPDSSKWQFQAKHSYREGAVFVDHDGIAPSGSSVASWARRMLGMDSIWSEQWQSTNDAEAGLQAIPKEYTPPAPLSPEERKRNDAWYESHRKKRMEREMAEAESRANATESTV
jgi:hypothetical protein